MSPTTRKHIKKKQAKLSDSTKRKVGFGALGFAGVAVLVFVILCFVFGTQNTANPTHFVLADRLDCTINSDRLIYDEANNCDCIEINMTFKNVTNPYDNSDPDIRTADQVSPEEEDAMSEEEKDIINRNSALKGTSRIQTIFDVVSILYLQAAQDGKMLTEPAAEIRADGKENNADAMEPRLEIGQTADISLYFKLANQADVQVAYNFNAPTQKDDNSFTDEFGDKQVTQLVTFARAGQTTPQLWAYLTTHSLEEGQSANNVEWHDLQIPLRDGWYVDKQGTAAITLKNPQKSNAKIEFSYSSGQTAEQYARETANWSSPAPEVTTTTINGTTYYTYTSGNLIVLCRDASVQGASIRIALTNLSLDDAQPYL